MKAAALLVALLAALLPALPRPLAAATVKVRIGKQTLELPLEKYVAGVLAGEAAVFRSDEALKAMAVAARTYAVRMRGRHANEGFDFCSTTHCQRFEPDSAPRLDRAAAATAAELLWYRGHTAFTPYSLDCGGRTEDAASVWPDEQAPYLSSHSDEFCVRAGLGGWQWAGDAAAIADALRHQGLHAPSRITTIRIAQRTASGRAQQLELIGDSPVRIDAGTFRFAIGRELGWNTLRSDWFEAHAGDRKIFFAGRGSGHGVGLCQRGADRMGTEGRGYREILAYYFPGTEPGVSARGFEWQRLGGDGFVLYTTRPVQDRPMIAALERALRDGLRRTGWPQPRGIEVRVYPDVESFRDATGEPGWVAAYTHGTRIELQPVRDAEPIIRHETWHVLIESQAAASLPLWFREGLVEYLAGGSTALVGAYRTGDALPAADEFRQIGAPARARRAYARAGAAVAALARRYGETALFRWVNSGIPSSAISPAANNK